MDKKYFSQKLYKYYRLKGKSNFTLLLKKKKIFKGKKYIFFYYRNDKKFNKLKFAVSVSKKIGSAVIRNHEKRWVREIIRKNINMVKGGGLLLVVVKEKDGYYKDAEEEILKFFKSIF